MLMKPSFSSICRQNYTEHRTSEMLTLMLASVLLILCSSFKELTKFCPEVMWKYPFWNPTSEFHFPYGEKPYSHFHSQCIGECIHLLSY